MTEKVDELRERARDMRSRKNQLQKRLDEDEETMKSKLKEAGEQVQEAHDITHKVRMELAEKVNMLDALRK